MEGKEKSLLEKVAQLEEAIKTMPIKLQNAVYWGLENLEVLQEIGRESDMTLEEIQEAMNHALQAEKYAELVLLCVAKVTKESKGNEER